MKRRAWVRAWAWWRIKGNGTTGMGEVEGGEQREGGSGGAGEVVRGRGSVAARVGSQGGMIERARGARGG